MRIFDCRKILVVNLFSKFHLDKFELLIYLFLDQ